MKNSFHTDHTLIIDELETSIKFHNLDLILGFLPEGSYLVIVFSIPKAKRIICAMNH